MRNEKAVTKWFASLVLALGAAVVEAAVVFENPLEIRLRGLNSDFDNSTLASVQQIASRFQLESSVTITDVHWYGHFHIDGIPQSVGPSETFVVRFFEDAGGDPISLPKASPFASILGSATTKDTGIALPSPPGEEGTFYEFSLDPISPITLSAGVRYWISILDPARDSPVSFAWADGTLRAADSQSAFRTRTLTDEGEVVTAWEFTGRGQAFSLTVNIPEPASLALSSLGLACMVLIRRKRQAKQDVISAK